MAVIYLDHAATTPVLPLAAKAALEAMTQCFGNPSSLHKKGLEAELVVERARRQIAETLACLPDEIVFTSGGTEANNLAILGVAGAYKRRGNTIITTEVEHSSVGEPIHFLEQQGYTVVRIPPLADGSLNVDALVNEVTADTLLVSAMLVNSEVGSISAIGQAVKRVKRKNPETLFHTDGVQGFGKIPISTRQLGVDLLSVSGHKVQAPKGVGALYVKNGMRLRPLLYGGGQEKGLRGGTESVPLIAAFGVAVEEIQARQTENKQHMAGLYEHFVNKLQIMDNLCSNSTSNSTLYIQNVSVLGYRSEILLHYLAEQGIYVSSGSACAKGKSSHVLTAMGLPSHRVDSALRISMSPATTVRELNIFFSALTVAQQDLVRSHS